MHIFSIRIFRQLLVFHLYSITTCMSAELDKATDLDENSCLLCGISERKVPWRC